MSTLIHHSQQWIDQPDRESVKKAVHLNTIDKMGLTNIHKTFYPRIADIHSTEG